MANDPRRGEIFRIPAESIPFENATDVDVYVTYARRSLKPLPTGACITVQRDDPDATGWFIEYRSMDDGPIVDQNTPGLHQQYVSDASLSQSAVRQANDVHETIPKDHEVQPIDTATVREPDDSRWAVCGHCGLTWDDGVSTGITPVPSGRCPFEQFHTYDEDDNLVLVYQITEDMETAHSMTCEGDPPHKLEACDQYGVDYFVSDNGCECNSYDCRVCHPHADITTGDPKYGTLALCRHCGRRIIFTAHDGWIDPEASGDDVIWREGCDQHDTFEMRHEPEDVQLWDDDLIQFARLLCEINATHSEIDVAALCESMDLEYDDIDTLFDRAHVVWEQAKESQR